MTVEEIKAKIKPILIAYKVKKAGIFGSIARGEQNEKSDVDILVEVDDEVSLLDFVELKLALEAILSKKVDLGEYSTIKPLIKKQILDEQIIIL